MAVGHSYRAFAADCDARARRETEPAIQREWEGMALAYRRMAERAEHNARTDESYEAPPPQTSAQEPQPQQHQQSKLEPEE